MDIKEIAEQVSKRIYVEDGLLLSKFISEKFAEALIESYKAELLKEVGEPVAFLHQWIEYHPYGDTVAGEPCSAITNDGMTAVSISEGWHLGNNLREAIDAAMAQG